VIASFACRVSVTKTMLDDALVQRFSSFEIGFDFGIKAIANRAPRRFYFAKGLGLNSPKSKRFSPIILL
jgi:hypothetical protein